MSVITLTQIAEALGVHRTSAMRRADREGWQFAEETAPGRSVRSYTLEALPREVQKALQKSALETAVNQVSTAASTTAVFTPTGEALPPVKPAAPVVPFCPADLTTRQRENENARSTLLGEISRLQASARCSQEAAITALLTNARSGLLPAHLVGTLRLARDPRGRKTEHDDGLPSPRSLKRWLSKSVKGESLAPAVVQADMSVKPWHGLAIALMQRPQGSIKRWVVAQIAEQWTPAMGETPPSYDQVCRFFREKFSKIDVLVGRHTGMDLKNHRRYTIRSRVGLMPAMECHADGWCTHFTAPHPVSGEFVTYELWTAIDYATGYPADPAIGLSESYEVIAKCLENYIRVFGVPLIFQTDSTGRRIIAQQPSSAG